MKTANAPARVWNVWRILTLGTGLLTPNDFKTALVATRNLIGMFGSQLIESSAFRTAGVKTNIPLILVSDMQLNLPEYRTAPMDILKRGQELGLRLLPFEAGPQLRLQLQDQEPGTIIYVATEPITIGRGYDPHLFELYCDKRGLWLRGSFYSLHTRLEPGTLYVFTVDPPAV